MSSTLPAQLTKEDLKTIETAVQQAESRTGGEIVPVLSKSSSFYEIAMWRAGAVSAIVCGLLVSLLYLTTSLLIFVPPYLWLLIVLTAVLLGMALAVSWPTLKRWLIGRKLMEARVTDLAKNMFVDHGVHLTEPRTGILVYISFFEHRAVILADIGIAELVPEQKWQEIVAKLTAGLKQGQTVRSITDAILACGKVLEESGVHSPSDNDDNPLSDEVRVNE